MSANLLTVIPYIGVLIYKKLTLPDLRALSIVHRALQAGINNYLIQYATKEFPGEKCASTGQYRELRKKAYKDAQQAQLFYAVLDNDIDTLTRLAPSAVTLNRERFERRLDSPQRASAFEMACRVSSPEMVSYLISLGANVNSVNSVTHVTPVIAALQGRQLATLTLLKEAGANFTIKFEAHSTLYWAYYYADQEIVQFIKSTDCALLPEEEWLALERVCERGEHALYKDFEVDGIGETCKGLIWLAALRSGNSTFIQRMESMAQFADETMAFCAAIQGGNIGVFNGLASNKNLKPLLPLLAVSACQYGRESILDNLINDYGEIPNLCELALTNRQYRIAHDCLRKAPDIDKHKQLIQSLIDEFELLELARAIQLFKANHKKQIPWLYFLLRQAVANSQVNIVKVFFKNAILYTEKAPIMLSWFEKAWEGFDTRAIRFLSQSLHDMTSRLINIPIGTNQYTPLMIAITYNSLDMVTLCLHHGANPNVSVNQYTPLGLAIAHAMDTKNLAIVKCLLKAGADPNIGGEDFLVKACQQDQHPLAELLIHYGASVNGKIEKQSLAIWAENEYKSHELISLLVCAGCPPLIKGGSIKTASETTQEALRKAVDTPSIESNLPAVARFIKMREETDRPEYIQPIALSECFDTASPQAEIQRDFIKASGMGDVDVMQNNILLGVDINAANRTKQTAITAVIKSEHLNNKLEVIQLLVSWGADCQPAQHFTDPIQMAAKYGEIEILDYLVTLGVDINGGDNHKPPLCIALIASKLETATWLLEHGANPDALYTANSRAKPTTGLDYIIKCRPLLTDAAKLLLQFGAKRSEKISVSIIRGATKKSMDKLLLLAGYMLDEKNKKSGGKQYRTLLKCVAKYYATPEDKRAELTKHSRYGAIYREIYELNHPPLTSSPESSCLVSEDTSP